MATAFHITDQVCACGCDTRLSSLTVERGWKYIRGHKPAHLKPATKAKRVNLADRPVTLAKKTFSYADTIALCDAEIPMLQEQCREFNAEFERVSAGLQAVAERLDHLHQLRKEAEALVVKHG